MASSSESSDEEFAKNIAAAAVSADALKEQADRSTQASTAPEPPPLPPPPLAPPLRRCLRRPPHADTRALACPASCATLQVAQQRAARARARRAGGGGLLGALPTDGGEGEAGAEDGLLDAAQRRVAEALQKRLQRELEGLSEDDQGEQQQAAAPPPQQQAAADDGSGEEQVRLFRRVKAGAPVLDRQQLPEAQQQGAAGDGSSQAASSRQARCLEKPTKARCKAAAVEADAILGAAAVALQQSAQHVSPRPNWVPADDDPSRLSHRRKRRLAKLAAEAQAGKLRLRVLRRQAARAAAAAQEATAQQAAAV